MTLETNKLVAVITNKQARVNEANRSLQTRGCLINLPESAPPAFVYVFFLQVLEINVTPYVCFSSGNSDNKEIRHRGKVRMTGLWWSQSSTSASCLVSI